MALQRLHYITTATDVFLARILTSDTTATVTTLDD